MVSSRARASSVMYGGAIRMQCDLAAPRPMRPRKLMQLRQPKALGMLDDHHGGVRNIHADFDDRGGHQNLHFVLAELLHHRSFSSLERRPCSRPSFSLGKTSCDSRSNSSMAAFNSSFDSSITG